MRFGFVYLLKRSYPGLNYIKDEVRQKEINFYDWYGKYLLKNVNFCINLVSYTPSNGIRSLTGFEIIFIMFMASGFIFANIFFYLTFYFF